VIGRVCLLAAVMSSGGIDVRATARDIDAGAVATGVDARLGAAAEGWVVEVQPGATDTDVHLQMRTPDGRPLERDVELEGTDRDSRSRELASMLALLVEEASAAAPSPQEPPPEEPPPQEAPAPPATVPPAESLPRVTGWLALVGRVALNPGRPIAPDPGVGLAGGVWLDRLHLQPVAQVAWGRTPGSVVLDGVRMGAGLLAGSQFGAGRWWAGGGVIAHAMWAQARAEERAHGWGSSTELLGVVQVRGRWWMVGARLGVDVVLPPLRAFGDDANTRWSAVRPSAGVLLGLRIPAYRGR
jgi:hypothetical protein